VTGDRGRGEEEKRGGGDERKALAAAQLRFTTKFAPFATKRHSTRLKLRMLSAEYLVLSAEC